jgi:UDP-glucuronate 4-epimerase
MTLIRAAETALAKKANIHYLERPATEPAVTFADTSKARRLLDFEPLTPFNQGYQQFFEWYAREGRE